MAHLGVLGHPLENRHGLCALQRHLVQQKFFIRSWLMRVSPERRIKKNISFRRYSRFKSEVVQNRAKFCTFLAPIFRGQPPEFLDLHQTISSFMRQHLENGTRYSIQLLLMTNRKLNMYFRLAPRSMTLNDLELL